MGVNSIHQSVTNGAKILKTHESVHSIHKPHHYMAHIIHKPLGQWREGSGVGEMQ